MIHVIISDIFIILLTLLGAGTSGHPAIQLFVGGGLLISVTAGYVQDGEGKLLKILQLFLAVLFAFLAGNWWGCLVFVCLLWPEAWQTILLEDGVLAAEGILFLTFAGHDRNILRFPWGEGAFGIQGEMDLAQRHGMGRFLALWVTGLFLIDGVSALLLYVRFLMEKRKQKEEEDRRRIQNFSLSEMHEIQKSKELARQSFYAEKNARLIERENISRNIHNSVGHSITAAIMTLDAADLLFEKRPEEAHKKMNDATDRIRGSLSAIRSAVRALDDEGRDISVKDLICFFDNILDEFLMDTERSCDRTYDFYERERELPREHVEFLTGALEELLTNGVKHGNASCFVVKLSGDSAHLQLEVKDNGRSGFNDDTREELIQNGFGLKKLAAYAERCGGHATFQNENGFRAVITLPV